MGKLAVLARRDEARVCSPSRFAKGAPETSGCGRVAVVSVGVSQGKGTRRCSCRVLGDVCEVARVYETGQFHTVRRCGLS